METIVISLGGSLIIPEEIDIEFLKNFRNLILSQVSKGKKFVIITGGGKVCRKYQDVARELTLPSREDLDWMGIAATRLNAELLRVVFGENAQSKIVLDPDVFPKLNKSIVLGAGWKPGNSSDLAAVHSAISVGAKRVVNLSNIDFVYDKDPKKYSDAFKIEQISWTDFRKLLPEEWDPGLNVPFDPIAAEKAESMNIEVDILNGNNISNLEKCLDNEDFIGTKIR